MRNKILEIIEPAIKRCIAITELPTQEEKNKAVIDLMESGKKQEDHLVVAILATVSEYALKPTKAFLDIESNGWQGSSVLSIAVIKCNGLIFKRFYYPVEEYNEKAVEFNGLTEEKVDELRAEQKAEYPRHFIDDTEFADFMSNVDTLVCQNIIFDHSFLPVEVTDNIKNMFCTMKSNMKYFEGKWPNLKSLCEFYNIPVDEEKQHHALYDAQLCKLVFEAMKDEDIIYTHDYLTKQPKPKA